MDLLIPVAYNEYTMTSCDKRLVTKGCIAIFQSIGHKNFTDSNSKLTMMLEPGLPLNPSLCIYSHSS